MVDWLVIGSFLTYFLGVSSDKDLFNQSHLVVFPEIPIVPSWSEVLSCREDSNLFLNSIQNNSKWAVEMWDSSAKVPTGWLYGNEAQLGNFDECKDIDGPYSVKFCVGKVNFEAEKGEIFPDDNAWTYIQESMSDRSMVSRGSIFWGICVPASCPASDFKAVQTGNSSNDIKNRVPGKWSFSVAEEFCTDLRASKSFTYGEIIFWFVTILILVLTAISTCLDLRSPSSPDCENGGVLCRKLLQSFSLVRNLPKLIEYDPETSHHPLGIFHGLRFASVVFVLYGHRTGIPISFSAENHKDWESHLKNIGLKFVAQTDMTVDTFFFISGVLLSFSVLKSSTHPFTQILTRIFRLVPIYLWIIFFEAFAMPRLGSGPFWQVVQETESAMCARNWWLNALFLQNYIKDSEMCMTHTWYIPCEMHFFLASLVILTLIKHKKTVGLSFLMVLCIIFTVIPGFIVFWRNMDPLVLFYYPDFLENPRANKTFLEVYVKSHNRAAVYLIGLMSGYFLSKTEDKGRKPNLKRTIGLFFLSMILMGIPMVYGVHFYSPLDSPSALEKGIFAALRRPVWAIGLFCLILANTWGPIPILSRVLTSRAPVVLGRISYALYLLHFPIIMANMAKMRQAPVFNWFDVVFSGDLASTCIFAATLYVFLEVPARTFFTFLFFHKPRSSSSDVETSRV